MEKNKSLTAVIILIVFLILLVITNIVISLLILFKDEKPITIKDVINELTTEPVTVPITQPTTINREQKLNDIKGTLKELGIDFYQNFYYPNLSNNGNDAIEFVKKYETIGIKIDLQNLYNSFTNDSRGNKFDVFEDDYGNKCDYKKTKVIIYPKSPYGNKDYTVETEISCDNLR